jgi:hypothetical protein
MLTMSFLKWMPTVDNMAIKGLRAISYQGTRKVEAGYKLSHTSETLNGYIVCCAFGFLSSKFYKIIFKFYI